MSKDSKSPERLSPQLATEIQERWGVVYYSTDDLKDGLLQGDPQLLIDETAEANKVDQQRIHETVVAGTAINAANMVAEQEQAAEEDNLTQLRRQIREIQDEAA